jgi:phosphonate degradation associated HDIG domain protein
VTDALETLASLFEHAGMREYFGESVSVSVHMLQAGALAEAAGAPDHLVAAALLHDVGHLRSVQDGSDDRHEETGAKWLAAWLPAEVTEPIRLHVAAKRYLCATEPGYLEMLSAASLQSLELQGGPMTSDEAGDFHASPYASDAVAVRRWDEAAKDPKAVTPDFNHFRPVLQRLLTQ